MKKKGKISIIDIAKELGVSKGTVSSVLNGKATERRISEETQKVILEYIEQSGFRPNSVARSLRTGRTHIIGMLVEDISNPFFASIAHLVEKKVAYAGYRILLASTENDNDNAAEALMTFWEQQVDGYIIVPSAELPVNFIAKILGQKPLVLFDRTIEAFKTNCVLIDNYDSMVMATKHLIENRFRHIAFITIESTQLQMKERLRGYENTLLNEHLISYILKVDRSFSNETIKEQIKNFIEKHPLVDAIIFSTNYIALLGLQVLKEQKIRIPGKIGVIGFDESPYYELINPAITSVVQPLNEMADCMVDLLMEQLNNGEKGLLTPKTIELNAVLMPRKSTGKHDV